MNEYFYEDLAVGQMAEFEQTVTEMMVETFKNITGDTNPLHCEDSFARSKGFEQRVVYGMLSAALYSRLAGVHLPGENCLLQSVHADFLRPVYIGDHLIVRGEIVEKHDSVKQIMVKASIFNQNGDKVSKAKIEAGVI